jgi:hypothetical protein
MAAPRLAECGGNPVCIDINGHLASAQREARPSAWAATRFGDMADGDHDDGRPPTHPEP